MSTTVWALQTANKEAKALIFRAQARCEGCRLSWRLDLKRGERLHRFKGRKLECTAKEERQALRDIAARNRETNQ